MKAVSTSTFYSRRKRYSAENVDGGDDVSNFCPNERKRKIWEEKLQKIENTVQSLRDQFLPIERKARISDPLSVYQLFPKQQQAFDFSKTCEQDVIVFSKELNSDDGKRNYLVTTGQEFWKMYKTLPCEERRYYEVIPEGLPCRLYFDLEFKKELNPQHDGEEMVEIFIKCVCNELMKMYKIHCDGKNVVYMDSSTESKFSAHLVFHLPNTVFKDNIHAGRFVEYVCGQIYPGLEVRKRNENQNCESSNAGDLEDGDGKVTTGLKCPDMDLDDEEIEYSSKGDLQKLIIKNSKGGRNIFCDRGVYTKNRNFRLYLSTKIGRNSPLVLSKKNLFQPTTCGRKSFYSSDKDSEFWLFLDTMVSNFSLDPDCRILTFDDVPFSAISQKCQTKCRTEPVDMGQESPYPKVDQFIKENISRGSVQGYIRRCAYFKEGNTITYDIGNNRWCANIGRPHKSNHIMMVVDLNHGVYYQKCHDPDCRRIGFRSPEQSLPRNINPVAQITPDEYFLKCLDEDQDEFLSAVKRLESEPGKMTSI